jgi:hypothetical protein
MLIANPLYDTVFKFMMNDSKVAKTLLSAIIGEKIVELEFSATEYILKADADKSQIDRTLEQLTVCRFDFTAKIETETGDYKTIHIELQKAKLATDIMRFRRYLGTMYQDPENTYDEDRIKARQIYCIYFLNYEVGFPGSHPIIRVDYNATDLTTGEKLSGESEFINSLNHKSWIVQVRQLRKKRRNELENLLSIFDQSNIAGNRHILEIDETQYPEKYRLIIRKLLEAYASKKVRTEMQMEDDYLNELLMKDKLIAKKDEEITKRDELIAKRDEEITKRDELIVKRDEEITKRDGNYSGSPHFTIRHAD